MAVFAYKVGWEPKGWPPDRPWVGVSTHLRSALVSLATHDGLITSREQHGDMVMDTLPKGLTERLAFWSPEQVEVFGELHPMDPNARVTLQRLTLALLERVLPGPAGLVQLLADPLRWMLNGRVLAVRPEDLFTRQALRHLQRQVKQGGDALRPPAEPWEHWLTVAPLQLRLWSMAWLGRLQDAVTAGQPRLQIRLTEDDPLPLLALWDTLELLEATRRLYNLDWTLPQVSVDGPTSERVQTALRAYLGHPDGLSARQPLFPLSFGPLRQTDVAIGNIDDLTAAEQGVHWSREDAYGAALRLQRSLDLPFQEYQVTTADRAELDFFFARFFAYPRLRDEQFAAIQRVLAGESMLVLLPTGFGKSVIYQLLGLIQPGVALIVSPLTALIKDQISHLREGGIVGAGSVTGAAAKSRLTLEKFALGRYRLFYCAPERFDTVTFKQTVATLISRHRISLVAVDEAHCVSEWGHDFRPAYMHVRNMRHRLQADTQHPVPILALTATASPVVRHDIQRSLGIPVDSVIQTRSSDRPELSFSVHAADGHLGRQERLNTLDRVFNEVAPKLFGPGVFDRLDEDHHFENGAVVFTPYADNREPALYGGSTSVVAEHLQRQVLTEAQVGMYGGTAPGSCPGCGSHNFYRHFSQYRCNSCHHRFVKAEINRLPAEAWDAALLETQDGFMSSALPVLVSTKAFGMGVDKTNIRLVTHYVMSGSLEAYYQEAGRAGRNGEHAHVAMVTVLPDPRCDHTYLSSGRLTSLGANDVIPLPCLRKNAGGYTEFKCEYGLTELCDVGMQASFIALNFPSADVDHTTLMQVFDRFGETSSTSFPDPDTYGSPTQSALSRLATLSLVKSYAKTERQYRVDQNLDWQAGVSLNRLDEELASYEQVSGAPIGTRSAVQALRDRPQLTRREYADLAGRVLIDTLYSTVRSMRLFGLMNLYRFAALPRGQCRRVHLRRSFEITPLKEDYRCGFCDTCQPDLNFTVDRAFTPVILNREQELGLTFETLLETFDLKSAADFLRACIEARVTASFLGRSDYLLEQRPNDPALLFLNAAFHAVTGNAVTAQQIAYRAVRVLRRAGQSADQLHPYLLGLDYWQPGLAVALYTAVNGPFDDPQGRPVALANLAGLDQVQAQRLALVWGLTELTVLAVDLLTALPSPLQSLES